MFKVGAIRKQVKQFQKFGVGIVAIGVDAVVGKVQYKRLHYVAAIGPVRQREKIG